MADISKVKLPDNVTYNLKDNSAVANITRSGTTFTVTKRDGTTFTFTQQDTNTTYTIGTSGNNITLTPSSGSVQSITAPYATSAGSATKATQDGSGNTITSTYVKKSGDTMTGELKLYREGTTTQNLGTYLTFQNKDTTTGKTSNGYIIGYDGGENGLNMVLTPGGNMFIGSGEAAQNHYNLYTHNTGESFYATSDYNIYLQANGQTIANRVGVAITTDHALIPVKADVGTNNVGSIGTSSYKWANGYFTNINGVAVGNSPKFTDTNTTYTLGTSGNNVTLTPSSGSAQSVTVPYATSAADSGKLNGYASDTAATNNTIVRRTDYGYIFAKYLNQSSKAETPTTDSYWMYCNSDGYLRKSSRDNLNGVISPYEARLQWGGKDFSADYGCIDAAMVNELGANRLMFTPGSAVTVEYSRDNGSTWTDYRASNTDKTGLFSSGANFFIGKADSSNKATANGGKYQLRVTIDTGAANIYTVLNKLVILISTNGSAGSKVKIQKALQSTPTTFVDHKDWTSISGWSGYNVLNITGLTTYGNTAGSQYGRIRFIFADGTGGNTNYTGLQILKIMGFGGVGWNTPSTMAKIGHLYSFDASQNATFPAQVTATQFNGALSGNATSATTSKYLTVPRVAKNSQSLPGANKCIVEEYTSGTNYNLPSNAYYHIYSSQGPDTHFGCQLALGMTTEAAYYRVYNNQSWGNWKSIINTNTHRPIQMNGTEILGNNTTVLNLKAGSNVTLSHSSGTVTIAATDTNTHRPIQVDGTEILGNNTTALNLVAGTNVSLSNDGGAVTITATDTNNAVAITNTNPTRGTWYYPVWYTGTSGTGNVNANDGFRYHSLQGTASAAGQAILSLGNGTATGTAGNKYGEIRTYSQKQGYSTLTMASGATAERKHTLPDVAGTIGVFTATPTSGQVVVSDGTAGGFKTTGYTIAKSVPSDAVFTDTNTHRPIQVNGTEILGNNTTALNLKAGSNVSVTNSSGTVTIAATNTNDAVKQTKTTTDANYDILFSVSTSGTDTKTEGARKDSKIAYNPNKGLLKLYNTGADTDDVLQIYSRTVNGNTTSESKMFNVTRGGACSSVSVSTGILSVSSYVTTSLKIHAASATSSNTPAQLTLSVKDNTTGKTYDNCYIAAYNDHASTSNGNNMVIRSGGGMFIGSGEAASEHYVAKGASYSGEDCFITADGAAYLQANANTITQRVGLAINSSHQVLPVKADTGTNNIGSIGADDTRWANLYVTNIQGGTAINTQYKDNTTNTTGFVMHGRTNGNKYSCIWQNSKLNFYVDTTNVGNVSDRQLKSEIDEIDPRLMEAIAECKIYQYKAFNRDGLISVGIIAQDLVEKCEEKGVRPENYELLTKMNFIQGDDTLYYSVDYNQYATFMIDYLQKKVNELEARI